MAETFEEIGTDAAAWWFWALKPFKGKLYAGTYKMDGPKIYNYPPWQHLKTFGANGTAGESVLRLVEFNNEFYCNSECMGDEGHTYRMTTADPTEWKSVHHEEVGWYPKPLIVFKGYLYAGWFHPTGDRTHGDIKILRSSDGDSWTQCKTWSDNALLSFFVYNNQLYIVSRNDITGKSWGARTSDGTNWSDVPILCGRDYSWTHGVVFNDKVYIGQVGESIYRYDGTSLEKVLQVNVDITLTQDLGGLVFDGKIYFLFAQSWKATSGNVYLYQSDTGNLNDWGAADLYGAPFHTFTNVQNGACMAEFEGDLYLGVGGPLVGSVVYKKSSEIPYTDVSWARGVVSLNVGIPTIQKMNELGLKEVMPFGWSGNETALLALANNGIKLCPKYSQLPEISKAYEQQYNIMAYFIDDEPEFHFTPQEIIDKINALRALTDLPITCNFTSVFWLNEPWMVGRWGDHYPEVFARLDFICFDSYFYREGGLYQQELDFAIEAIARIKAENKSFIGLAQGHESVVHGTTTPDIGYTDNFWKSNDGGVWWYGWNVDDYSVGDRGGALNDWYNKEIARVNGMIPGHWTTKQDFEEGTLNNILVPEGLNRLELKKLALSGTGVWIFDGGPGRKFKWLSFVSTKPNQNVFYRDDFRDNSIADWTIEGGTWNCINEYMRGYADVVWETNGMTVGYDSWQGVDILMKIFPEVSAGEYDVAHHVWLRCDPGRDNAYLWTVSTVQKNLYRISGDAIAESHEPVGAGIASNAWRWWRLQIYTSGGHVFTRTRDWAVGSEEPGTWEYTHEFTSVWRAIGCIGVGRHDHTGGKESRWDNILVSRKEGIPFPANCGIGFKFWASSDRVSWGSQYTDITKVPNSRFIKIQATLQRTSLLSAMPTIEDMALGYRLAVQPIFI